MGQAAWCSALFCALFRSLFEHCSWTLFMDNVHRVSKKKKKKEYKIFKNFLVGDLIYKIFIWQLL